MLKNKGKGNIFVQLDKEWFEENKDNFVEETSDSGEKIVIDISDASIDEDFVSDKEITTTLTTENVYASLSHPLESKYVSDIVEHAIKKLNKFKTVWEGLK